MYKYVSRALGGVFDMHDQHVCIAHRETIDSSPGFANIAFSVRDHANIQILMRLSIKEPTFFKSYLSRKPVYLDSS